MTTRRLMIAAAVPMLALAACTGENKAPDQNRSEVTAPAPADSGPGAESMIKVDEFPSPAKTVNPDYPEDARKNGIEGMVFLNVLVSREGTVTKAVVAKRTDGTIEMEQAAIDAVKRWTFKPAIVGNKPVECWVAIPFKFKLADK